MNHEICMYEKCNEVLTIKYEPWICGMRNVMK